MFLRFLKKWFFNLCLKLLSEFVNVRSVGNCSKLLVSDTTNFFDQNTCCLKDVLVSKQKFLYLLDFDQRTSFLKTFKALEKRYWLNLSETERQLNFSKSLIPVWLLLYSWIHYLIHPFWTVCNLLLNFLFRFGYQAEQHNQEVVGLNHYTRVVSDMMLNICFSCKGI